MAFNKPNIKTGQVADMEEKSASRKSTIRDDLRSMQQQLTAALIRETEQLALLRKCKAGFADMLDCGDEADQVSVIASTMIEELDHI